ncbi:MAG: leucine-rich repeat domain-containing protein [Firmicutes bacterium]|nr:leucine-rich repeat domain-containing protein [Bacillota bacterium]
MKTKKKLIFSLILALALCVGVIFAATLSMSAEDETTVTASGTCGDNLTWTLTSDGTLTISGEGEMYDYSKNITLDYNPFVPWYPYCDSITTIVVEDGVTSIGSNAFYGLDYLVSATIGDSATTINICAFENSSLTSVTIGNGVIIICDEAFAYCADLTSATIGDSVTTICDYAFFQCTSLESIIIPDSVTTMESAFVCCRSLTSVTLGSGLTTIAGFGECTSLTSITIPDSVTTIGSSAFYGCESLTEITFEGDAPSIGYAFSEVTATAYYPSGNDTWTDDVMQDYGGTITWVAYDVNSDDSGDAVASGACGDNLTWTFNGTTLTVSGTGDMYDFSAGEAPWNSYCDSIVIIEVEDGVTSIGEYAFCDCTVLLNIISMGNNVASIGDYAFYGCTNLSTVNYDGFEEEWNSISIGSNNSCLTDATILFKETETGTDDEIDYSSFNASIYQANKIISGFGGLYAFDYELDQETTSELIVYYSEENNADDLIALWESFSMAIDTMDDITNIANLYLHVDEVDIYSALILDSLEESTSGASSFSSYQNAVKILKTMLSDLSTLLKTSYEIDTTDFKGYDLTGEEAEALEKDISKWFDEKYPGFSYTSDLLKIMSNGFKIMGNISDYIDYAASCITLMQVSESMEEVLELAYEKRSSTNGATDAMAIALKLCLNMITDSTEECIAAILDGVLAMAGYDSIKWIIKEGMWKGITSYLKVAFPELYFLKVAYSAGRTISNALFSTDDTAEQYIKLRYLVWLESLINSVYDDVEKEFISGQTEEQAEAYLSALRLVFKLRDADYEEAYKYVDILETST